VLRRLSIFGGIILVLATGGSVAYASSSPVKNWADYLLNIQHVSYSTETTHPAFLVQDTTDPNLPAGTKPVIESQGKDGTTIVKYKETYRGNVLLKKEVASKEVIENPQAELVATSSKIVDPAQWFSSQGIQPVSASHGSICNDGWKSPSQGSGSCSWHRGVNYTF